MKFNASELTTLGSITRLTVSSIILLFNFWEPSPDKLIEKIRTPYKGIVIEKKSVGVHRPQLFDLTVLLENEAKVIEKHIFDTITVIGDRVYKPENSIYLFLSRENKVDTFRLITAISEETRRHTKWPYEWKDRWPETYYKEKPRYFILPILLLFLLDLALIARKLYLYILHGKAHK
jgi:hypothetical protein